MIIAIASGKGGTGKTTIATNLAITLAADVGKRITLADCDVEEPNASLFLKPEIVERETIYNLVPRVDAALCTSCGRCAEVCQYNALAVIKGKVLVFDQLCHGCGSCTLQCPEGAISEMPVPLGVVELGQGRGLHFVQGVMNVGVTMAPPIIRAVKQQAQTVGQNVVILDSPPGTSCPVVETLRDADYCLMVTEPTPFGLHDLKMAIQVARNELGLPVGVVLNRDGIGNSAVEDYCAAENIPILLKIPLDRRIARAYSDGETIYDALPEYRERFLALYQAISQAVTQ